MRWVVVVILCLSCEFCWLQGTRGRSGRRGRRGARGKRVQWLARNMNLTVLLCDCVVILSCSPDVCETTAMFCIKWKHLWFISFIWNISTCPAIVCFFWGEPQTATSSLGWHVDSCSLRSGFRKWALVYVLSCHAIYWYSLSNWAEIEMEFFKLASITVTRLCGNRQFPVV